MSSPEGAGRGKSENEIYGSLDKPLRMKVDGIRESMLSEHPENICEEDWMNLWKKGENKKSCGLLFWALIELAKPRKEGPKLSVIEKWIDMLPQAVSYAFADEEFWQHVSSIPKGEVIPRMLMHYLNDAINKPLTPQTALDDRLVVGDFGAQNKLNIRLCELKCTSDTVLEGVLMGNCLEEDPDYLYIDRLDLLPDNRIFSVDILLSFPETIDEIRKENGISPHEAYGSFQTRYKPLIAIEYSLESKSITQIRLAQNKPVKFDEYSEELTLKTLQFLITRLGLPIESCSLDARYLSQPDRCLMKDGTFVHIKSRDGTALDEMQNKVLIGPCVEVCGYRDSEEELRVLAQLPHSTIVLDDKTVCERDAIQQSLANVGTLLSSFERFGDTEDDRLTLLYTHTVRGDINIDTITRFAAPILTYVGGTMTFPNVINFMLPKLSEVKEDIYVPNAERVALPKLNSGGAIQAKNALSVHLPRLIIAKAVIAPKAKHLDVRTLVSGDVYVGNTLQRLDVYGGQGISFYLGEGGDRMSLEELQQRLPNLQVYTHKIEIK